MWQEILDKVRKGQEQLDRMGRDWCSGYTAGGGRIFCARGCRNCCNLVVNATFPEARRIAETMTGLQATKVRTHVERLLTCVQGVTDLKAYLRLHRQQIGFCPLLDEEGACGIYPDRPFSCRALLSTKESRWCGADFAALSKAEKSAYVDSLDRAVASFPLHYVAATQDEGMRLEGTILREMADRFGCSLYGNLPLLVYLEYEHGLSACLSRGGDAVERLMEQEGVTSPFLLVLDRREG